MQPAQIGGADVNPDNVNEALRKLAEIGAKKWPHEKPDVQFARAFESEPVLARAAHVRPSAPAGGAYPFPR
jgi:predicted RNA-binding Zn ribbon-like protein